MLTRLKIEFLSNMSHETRTPLIGISGMVDIFQYTTLNEEQMDYDNTIQASASSLLNIVNDILHSIKLIGICFPQASYTAFYMGLIG